MGMFDDDDFDPHFWPPLVLIVVLTLLVWLAVKTLS